MKKLLIPITILLASCGDTTFNGYIVGKDYIPAGQCHDNRTIYNYCGIIVVPHPPHVHKQEPDEYIWYIANKHEVRNINVSKQNFNKKSCGDKVKLFYSQDKNQWTWE